MDYMDMAKVLNFYSNLLLKTETGDRFGLQKKPRVDQVQWTKLEESSMGISV